VEYGLELEVSDELCICVGVYVCVWWYVCMLWLCLVVLQLFVIDNCVDDWRIAVSCRTWFQIAVELTVCVIHPPPVGAHYFVWRTIHADGDTVTAPSVPVDLLLSLPMFLRLYLIGRVLLLHSRWELWAGHLTLFTVASWQWVGGNCPLHP